MLGNQLDFVFYQWSMGGYYLKGGYGCEDQVSTTLLVS